MRLIFIGILLLALLSTGCASLRPSAESSSLNSQQLTPATRTNQDIDTMMRALTQSAQQIQRAVHEMREIQIAANLPDVTPNKRAQMEAMAMAVPPGLGVRISLSYDGLFTTLVEGVAKAVGWSYMVEGTSPPVIQVIHKEYNNVRAVDVLRDISYSVHGATIILDSINRRVIVRF